MLNFDDFASEKYIEEHIRTLFNTKKDRRQINLNADKYRLSNIVSGSSWTEAVIREVFCL